MASQPKPYYTPEEYLALERAAEFKSEYLAGEIFAMAGATANHSKITAHITRLLDIRFDDGLCSVFPTDMRVQVSATGLYTYPDVVAVCGEPEFADDRQDTLLNPTAIFEVLSPSTEAYDRGAKFDNYWKLPSVSDYVLVAQDRISVDHFVRQGNSWLLTRLSGLDQILRLDSLDADLALNVIYRNINLP